jgi:hypothetical protein
MYVKLTYAVDVEVELYPRHQLGAPSLLVLAPSAVQSRRQHRDYVHHILMAH